ncbi:unnamed protein product [Durusdinium trenchii]|uniref:Uncharacterized protein n=1 Tax=Durusdinium trenchii TaxID=1381693 RepID=A0ABP0INT7_9DINO
MQNLGRLSLLGKGASVEEVLQLALANRRRSSDQHVPGAVVVLHQTEERSRPGGHRATAPGNAPDFPEMGYLELAPKGISHHMAPVYREARLGEWTFSEAADMPCGHQEMVQVLFIKRCGTKAKGAKIAQCQWADEVFEDWLGRYAACADEKA